MGVSVVRESVKSTKLPDGNALKKLIATATTDEALAYGVIQSRGKVTPEVENFLTELLKATILQRKVQMGTECWQGVAPVSDAIATQRAFSAEAQAELAAADKEASNELNFIYRYDDDGKMSRIYQLGDMYITSPKAIFEMDSIIKSKVLEAGFSIDDAGEIFQADPAGNVVEINGKPQKSSPEKFTEWLESPDNGLKEAFAAAGFDFNTQQSTYEQSTPKPTKLHVG